MKMDDSDEISVIMAGQKFSYDGTWHDYKILVHYIQRLNNPLIKLTTLKQIMYFIEGADEPLPSVRNEDYEEGIIRKGETFDDEKEMNNYLEESGYHTRVLFFVNNSSEKQFKDELEVLRE